MSSNVKKILFTALAAALLVGVSFVQKSLNVDRAKLGLTRVAPLENAPPVLAFTTVALGGFRGLISNILWIRATDLQDEDKFFEMAQLADWITKLEPHFVHVWLVQAWNMAYNISVKFTDFSDRWRWVKRGIELLRDLGVEVSGDVSWKPWADKSYLTESDLADPDIAANVRAIADTFEHINFFARTDDGILVHCDRVWRPLRCGAGRIDEFAGEVERASHRHLEADHEAHIVYSFDRVVRQGAHFAILAQFSADGSQRA
jgi:hypothetical protein